MAWYIVSPILTILTILTKNFQALIISPLGDEACDAVPGALDPGYQVTLRHPKYFGLLSSGRS